MSLTDCLRFQSCDRLRYLNASGCDVTDATLTRLAAAECGKHLTELYLHDTEIGERGLCVLAGVADALQWLGLSNCAGVTDESVLAVRLYAVFTLFCTVLYCLYCFYAVLCCFMLFYAVLCCFYTCSAAAPPLQQSADCACYQLPWSYRGDEC